LREKQTTYKFTYFANCNERLRIERINKNQSIMEKNSVNDFDILTQIGKGTYARVILVRYKVDHKLYAMKVVNKQYIIQRKQSHSIMR
jgi:serine/threonine protein kinase